MIRPVCAGPGKQRCAKPALKTSPEELKELAQMEALATKYGYLCQTKELWKQELSTSIKL